MEKHVIIDGNIKGKEYLTANYSITSSDSSSVITVIERFYSRNDVDMYSYTERYKGDNGVVVINSDSVLGTDLTGNIAPASTTLSIEYYSNETLKTAKEEKKEATPDISATNRITLFEPYFSNKENIRFYAAKKQINGDVLDLTFAFPTNSDFRQQLYNLYYGLISINKIDREMITTAGVDEDIMPEKIGIFDAASYIKSYSQKQIKKEEAKELKK